jgi:phosphoglycolate phosphatase-like HAD superfamily hydrolase
MEKHKYSTKPPLVIFDVDGTLVDSLSPISPTISFYHNVINMGYHTVILTSRSEQNKEKTIDLLDRFGVKGYDYLIFRPDTEKETTKFKTNIRKLLATSYDIVANVGDRMFDFEGGYNGKIIHIVRLKT